MRKHIKFEATIFLQQLKNHGAANWLNAFASKKCIEWAITLKNIPISFSHVERITNTPFMEN